MCDGFCSARQVRGFRQVPIMSGAEASARELTSGVALPPPDDEFVSRSEGEFHEIPETLSGRYDSYEGVIVDPRSLPSDVSTFKQTLTASIAQWKREVSPLACSHEEWPTWRYSI